MNYFFKTIFVLFLIIAFQPKLSAQNITIDFTPIENLCSFDTLGCTAALAYPFSLSMEDATGLTVTHQVSIEGALPVEDEYGTLSGTYPGYIISGNYPVGNYSFELTAIQGSDTLVAQMVFSIVDCVAPVVECIEGLTVTLLPQPDWCCAMIVFGSDFIVNADENCSEPLSYSIYRKDEILDGTIIPGPSQVWLILDCDDYGVVLVDVYVWDNSFNPYALQPDGTLGGANYDFCETYILVQQVLSCIESNEPLLINGIIQTEDDEGVDGVQLTLIENGTQETNTNFGGQYSFELFDFTNYSITPYLNDNPGNGVSTFDAVLVLKHILGNQLLDSEYKLIAADVNASGTITVADVIQIRKLILQIYQNFPNNTSWRFVDADYVFPDPTNPWTEDFPEVIYGNNPYADALSENFIAIKIGDVNGSVTPN